MLPKRPLQIALSVCVADSPRSSLQGQRAKGAAARPGADSCAPWLRSPFQSMGLTPKEARIGSQPTPTNLAAVPADPCAYAQASAGVETQRARLRTFQFQGRSGAVPRGKPRPHRQAGQWLCAPCLLLDWNHPEPGTHALSLELSPLSAAGMAAVGENLRRRQRRGGQAAEGGSDPGVGRAPSSCPPAPSLCPGTFWLTRLVLLRATACIYCEWGRGWVSGGRGWSALVGHRDPPPPSSQHEQRRSQPP